MQYNQHYIICMLIGGLLLAGNKEVFMEFTPRGYETVTSRLRHVY